MLVESEIHTYMDQWRVLGTCGMDIYSENQIIIFSKAFSLSLILKQKKMAKKTTFDNTHFNENIPKPQTQTQSRTYISRNVVVIPSPKPLRLDVPTRNHILNYYEK